MSTPDISLSNFMNNQGESFARPKEYLDDYDFLVADDALNSMSGSGWVETNTTLGLDNDVTVAEQTLVEGDLEVDLTITRTSYNIGVEYQATYKGQDVTESIGDLLAAWEAEADGDGLTAAEKASIEAEWAAGLGF